MTGREEHLLALRDEWLAVVADVPSNPRAVLILCHGLTGDRVGPQRLLVRLSEVVAEHEYACVRFDFRGSGLSSGRFIETTFAGMRADLRVVCDWARERWPNAPLVLSGVSIGGVPAALEAPDQPACRAVVLVSSDLIQDVRFVVEGLVPIRGGQFHLPETFFREREQLRPRSRLAAAPIPAKVFYGALDEKLVAASDELERKGIQTEGLPGVDHLVEDDDIRRELARRIVEFLERIGL